MRKKKITELERLTPEEFKQSAKIPLVVILDNIRSLHNVGAVFRTADAFSVEKIYLCGITATPPHADIHKSALGAEDSVEWEYSEYTEPVALRLKQEGYRLCAIEQVESSIMLHDFKAEQGGKFAVFLGNEVKGVQQSVVDLCDLSIEIPQFGTKHSLNVSVTGGIIIWKFFELLHPSWGK